MTEVMERIDRLIERLQQEQQTLQALLREGRTLNEAERALGAPRGRRSRSMRGAARPGGRERHPPEGE